MNQINIVQVHLGKTFPEHIYLQLGQTRIFNPGVPIYLIVDDEAQAKMDAKALDQLSVIVVKKESLRLCPNHSKFQRHNRLNKKFWGGFWLFTSERFFVIESFLAACRLENVVHMENDVMLYAQLESLLPAFQESCPHVGLAMDAEDRCVPNILYFRDLDSLAAMNDFVVRNSLSKRHTDMQSLGSFMKHEWHKGASGLPVVPPRYRELFPLVNSKEERGLSGWYEESFGKFGGVFDAQALGQYVGGIDRRLEDKDTVGFVNEKSVYDARNMGLHWKSERGLKRPYGLVDGLEFPIYNLHMHSKRLAEVSSKAPIAK